MTRTGPARPARVQLISSADKNNIRIFFLTEIQTFNSCILFLHFSYFNKFVFYEVTNAVFQLTKRMRWSTFRVEEVIKFYSSHDFSVVKYIGQRTI